MKIESALNTRKIIFRADQCHGLTVFLILSFIERNYCVDMDSKFLVFVWILLNIFPNGVHAKNPLFNKHQIGLLVSQEDSLKIQNQSRPDSLKTKRTIKPGKVIGFAAIGFLSGLFFGAETSHGEINGATFYLKPAYIGAAIGAGLGIMVSLLEPEKPKRKKK